MSHENVELVRDLAEAFKRREHERVFDCYDPEIEWDVSEFSDLIPDAADVYRGHEGVRKFFRQWLSAWSDLEFEVLDVRDAGDEVVMLIGNQRQWGRHSGIVTEVPPYAMVFTFRGGKVVRLRYFADPESALEAVGLQG